MPSVRCCVILAVVVGILSAACFFVGIAGPIFLDKALQKGIMEQAIIDGPNAKGYDAWVNNTKKGDPPESVWFWIWNVTNAQDVIDGDIPTVEQVGPYAYREYDVYFNVTFNEDGSELTAKEWKYYVLDEENTVGNPFNDIVTVVNVPFQGVLGSLLFNSTPEDAWWKTLAFDSLASAANATLFVNLTVNQLIWGYEDPLLKLVASLQPGSPTTFSLQPNYTTIDEAAENTTTSTYNTGKHDKTQIMNYLAWNNQTSLTCWGDAEANKVQGNDGVHFWPGITQDDLPVVWADTIFRMIELLSNETVDVKGVKVYKFVIPEFSLQNSTMFPPNVPYFQYGQTGVTNVTSCVGGAPIFFSFPHFLYGPWYQARVRGMKPDPNLHETWIGIEPNIGVAFQAYKRLQFNVHLQQEPLLYPNIRNDLYVPVAWFQQFGGVTDELADQFKSSVLRVMNLKVIARWVGIAVGAVLVGIVFVMSYSTYKAHKKTNLYTRIQ